MGTQHITGILQIPSHSLSDCNHQRYYLTLQDAFPILDVNSKTEFADPYCIWFTTLPNTPTIKQKKSILIKKITYTISDWS